MATYRPRSLSPGDVIGGHRIDAIIGQGGMGIVFRATDLALNRVVALKVIAGQLANDPAFRERFKRESITAASIRHPNVIPIYHAGEEGGLLFITMLYIAGTDLRQLIATHGALHPQATITVIAQIASALDAAHQNGLVHRDVKPANILIESHNGAHQAFLSDFGLTKRMASEASGLTQMGSFVGTLDYCAPEQLQGSSIDARVDVYALGCVLYHALTGKVPFPRDSEPAKIWAHMSEEPPPMLPTAPYLPPDCEQVVRRAMAKDPAQRYPSAGDLGRAAVAAVSGQAVDTGERMVATGSAAPGQTGASGDTVAGEATRTDTRTAQPQRRRTGLLAGVAAGVVALAVAVAAVLIISGTSTSTNSTNSASVPTIVGSPTPVPKTVADIDAGGGMAWVANGNNTVTIISSSGKASTISLGSDAVSDNVVIGSGSGWADSFSDSISKINPTTGSATTIDVPDDPNGHALDGHGGSIWVLGISNGKLSQINPSTDKVVATVNVGRNIVNSAWCGTSFCLVYRDGTVRYLDLSSHTITGASTSLGALSKSPTGAIASDALYDDGTLFVELSSSEIARVDAASGVVANKLNVGSSTGFYPNEGSLWVIKPVSDTLVRFNETTGQQIGKPFQLPGSPQNVAADGQDVWVVVVSASGSYSVVHVRL